MYREGIQEIELFIEQGTERTPEPKRFYVFQGLFLRGEREGYRTLKDARVKYVELKEASGYVAPAQLHTTVSLEERSKVLANGHMDHLVANQELYWVDFRAERSRGRRR